MRRTWYACMYEPVAYVRPKDTIQYRISPGIDFWGAARGNNNNTKAEHAMGKDTIQYSISPGIDFWGTAVGDNSNTKAEHAMGKDTIQYRISPHTKLLSLSVERLSL